RFAGRINSNFNVVSYQPYLGYSDKVINSMFCLFTWSKPAPVESTTRSKPTGFCLKTFVRYCHLYFLNYALPPSNVFFFLIFLSWPKEFVVINHCVIVHDYPSSPPLRSLCRC